MQRAKTIQSAVIGRGRLIMLAVLLLCSTGCGRVDLYSDLGEREANEMMSLLLDRGVACSKTAGDDDGVWKLLVWTSDFSRSVEILKSAGYPHYRHERMGDVFQKSGLVSSPTEDRIRYVYALSEELSETISRIDGVVDARVHVVLPDNDPFSEKVVPSSASVYIKHRADSDMSASSAEIKALVAKSIERLDSENIDVFMDEVEPLVVSSPDISYAHVLGMKLGSESVRQFFLLVGGLAAAALINLGLVLWFVYCNYWGNKTEPIASEPAKQHKTAMAHA